MLPVAFVVNTFFEQRQVTLTVVNEPNIVLYIAQAKPSALWN